MKPLLFLTFRSFLNGIKRALSSPTRLLGLLFFMGYYFMWFIRPAMMGGSGVNRFPTSFGGQWDFPPLPFLNAVVFGLFAGLSILLMLGGAAQQGGFKAADVDMLFPTPLSPKLVLMFRMVRDYLLTLIMPMFILLIGIMPVRMGWEAMFRNMPHPEYASMVLRTGIIAWLLLSMCWVTLNYAISLHVNRSDLDSDRNRRIFGWTLSALIICAVAVAAYQVSRCTNVEEVLYVSFSPVLRIVFFTASFATMLTMAPLEGSLWHAILGGGALIALTVGAIASAMRQAGWMYDQAAVKGFSNAGLKQAQRQGDVLLAMAENVKAGRGGFRRLKWLSNLRMPGPFAIIWKDMFLQLRGMFWVLAMIFILGLFMTLMPLLFPDKGDKTPPAMLFLIMQGAAVFMCTITLANAGYLELLRRVDLQKPLPFTPSTTVFFEIASKALLGISICVVASIIGVIVKPAIWQEAIAAVIFAPALSLLMSGTVFMVIILFPDMDDQTQRQFRGMLQMLSLVVLCLPPVGLFIGLYVIHTPVALAALASAALCMGLAWFIATIAGVQYANFNPSE